MEKNFNFTQPFAMVCNAEQFESVRKEMRAMGYRILDIKEFAEYNCITNSYGGIGCVSNIVYGDGCYRDFEIIKTFNRDLCLALASMTDKPDGIAGEWFKGVNGNFIQKKDDCDIASIATKATADELIKYFSEIKPDNNIVEEMWKNGMNHANLGVIDEHKGFGDIFLQNNIEALQKRIEDLEYNVKLLTANMDKVIQQPEPQPTSRFADKQPIWAWDNCWSAKRDERFWDIKNNIPYNLEGKRSGTNFDNYEPIPVDQIPAWMIEAAKHLED